MDYKFTDINNGLIQCITLIDFPSNFIGWHPDEIHAHVLFLNKNGDYHREDGPAKIYPDGTQEWYKNGRHHREDGPAIIYANGHQYWWLNGVYYLLYDYFDKLVGPPYNKSPEEIEHIKAQWGIQL